MPLFILTVAACTNSGLGRTDLGDSTDTGSATTSEPCDWNGTWTLTAVACGSFPFDGWYIDHDEAALQVTSHPMGGCAFEVNVEGPSCSRSEAWRVSAPAGAESDAIYEGITGCEPAACALSSEEPTCKEGGATKKPVTITADDTSGDLVLESILADTAPDCSLSVFTTWTRAR